MGAEQVKLQSQPIAAHEGLKAEDSGTSLANDGHFKQLVDNLPQMVYELDIEGTLLYANQCALETFGYSAMDLKQGLNVARVIHPADIGRAVSNMALVMQGRGVFGAEYLAVRSDGSTFPIKIFSQGVFKKDVPVGVRGTILDITGARRTEEALKRSEVFYRTLFETTGTALATVSKDSIIRKCNSQFEILSGCSREEVEGKMKWSDFVDHEDLPRMYSYYVKRLGKGHGVPREYDFVFVARGGVRKHVHIVIEIIPGTEDRICSLSDITERIRAEEALRKSEERYSLVVRGANDGVWDWDIKNDTMYYSPRYKEVLGYTEEEFPNIWKSWENSVYPDDLESARAPLVKCVKGEVDHVESEFRMHHKDGSLRWILARGAGVKDDAGLVFRMAGTQTDITERKLNERSIQAMYGISKAISTTTDLQHLYKTIHSILGEFVDTTNFFIGLWDKESDRLVFPYFEDEKDDYLEIHNVSDPNKNCLTIHVLRTGEPLLITRDQIRSPEFIRSIGCVGTPPAVWLGVPLIVKDSIIGAMAVQHYTNQQHYTQHDVKFMVAVSEQVAMAIERKANEEALTQLTEDLENRVAQRTAELLDKAKELEQANLRLTELDAIKSALISSVSHELRTPLTSIRGFAKLTRKDFQRHFHPLAREAALIEKGEQIRSNLSIIESEGIRLTRLINDFLDINRIESGKATWNDMPVNPCEVIHDAVKTLRGAFATRKNVALRTNFPSTVPLILADPDKIKQVIINLLNNSYKFTLQGTVTVTISTFTTADTLTVVVDDTGIGIPKAELPYIFEKFHKTRTNDTIGIRDKGTGLGLAICREIVTHYGGIIWGESAPGEGSTFSFTLPAIPGTMCACPESTRDG